MGYIYCWKCKSTGKKYIGQTTETIEQRWKRHTDNALKYFENYSKYSRSIFYKAIRKYGINDFVLDWYLEFDNQYLDAYEIFYIQYFNTVTPNGYNIQYGGQNNCWTSNIFYLIDAETKEIIMHSYSTQIMEYLNINRNKWRNAAYNSFHICCNNKLYYILKDLIDYSDWCSTIDEYNKCRKNIKHFKLLSREGIAAGGYISSPAKVGYIIQVDTGELLCSGSYEICSKYIGMAPQNFKRQINKEYKSKKLGFKVLCKGEK